MNMGGHSLSILGIIKANVKLIFLFTLALLVFTIMYKACMLYPLYADDWNYSYIWLSDEKVMNLSDIIQSQYNHYFTWGGRSIVHFIAQALLMLDSKIATSLLNAFIFTSLTVLIHKLSFNDKESSSSIIYISSYILVVSLLWMCTPALSSVTMWITGSANYMWGSFIVLLFIYPYIKYLDKKEYKDSKYLKIMMPIGGLIAGWCNEATSLSTLLFLLVYILLLKKRNIAKRWMYLGLIGFFIGSSIMLLAPGNYIRLNSSLPNHETTDLSLFEILWNNLYSLYEHIYVNSHLSCLIALLITLYALYFYVQKGNKDKISISLCTTSIGTLSILAMMCSPQFPSRTLFFPLLCFLISISNLYHNLKFENRISKSINLLFISSLFLIFLWDANGRINSLKYISAFWERRIEYVENKKEEGIIDITFFEMYPWNEQAYTSGKYGINDLNADSTHWSNRAFARYYGIRSVKVKIK